VLQAQARIPPAQFQSVEASETRERYESWNENYCGAIASISSRRQKGYTINFDKHSWIGQRSNDRGRSRWIGRNERGAVKLVHFRDIGRIRHQHIHLDQIVQLAPDLLENGFDVDQDTPKLAAKSGGKPPVSSKPGIPETNRNPFAWVAKESGGVFKAGGAERCLIGRTRYPPLHKVLLRQHCFDRLAGLKSIHFSCRSFSPTKCDVR
jgi:hypothetical protein